MKELLLNRFSSTRCGIPVFNPVCLSLPSHHAYLCEGPNGAGKTTLLRSILGLSSFRGTIIWNKEVLPNLRAYASYLSIRGGLRDYLSVQDHLNLWCWLWSASNEKQENVCFVLNLSSCKKRMVATLSSGERQRLKFAPILLQDKCLWLLDEPFSHLDESGKVLLLSLLRSHLSMGGMALLTRPSLSARVHTLCFTLFLP